MAARTVIDEDGKVVYLDRTYVIDFEKQMDGPLLRVNDIAMKADGSNFEHGDEIKTVDFDYEVIPANKPQFPGWVGVKKVISTRIDVKPHTGSITDGLKVKTIFV